jgi:hypothetical protein
MAEKSAEQKARRQGAGSVTGRQTTKPGLV